MTTQNIFANLKTDVEVKETKQDVIFNVPDILDSGVYNATINQCYATESKGGALGLVLDLILKNKGNETKFITTLWITNRNKEITFKNSKGEHQYMLGYLQAQSLCKHLANKTLQEMTCKEMPRLDQMVNGYPELSGKKLAVGILKVRENKQVLNGTRYEPSNEEVFRNNLDKLFFIKNNELYTSTELDTGSEPKFLNQWIDKWEGQVQNRFKEIATATTHTTTPLEIG